MEKSEAASITAWCVNSTKSKRCAGRACPRKALLNERLLAWWLRKVPQDAARKVALLIWW